MGKPTGFMEYKRTSYPERAIPERLKDYKELYLEYPEEEIKKQGARCMDCGVPFCHQGCPLGNLIPNWNDMVYKNQWKDAIDELHATNNFPEFTGLLCPAPCEGSCVLGIHEPPVTIKYLEFNIIDHAFKEGWVKPLPPKSKTGKKVAVVGSGPAGLACAQELARAGHSVTVFERDDKIGGLLRYGIPDFKMEKYRIDTRMEQMTAEGVTFKTSVNVGVDITADQLKKDFDAVALCGGSTIPRDLPIPGREFKNIHFAMEYLTRQNRLNAGMEVKDAINVKDKNVIIIGGGDTGADCLGTAHRQGAKSIHQIELLSRPPETRDAKNPWPQWPVIYRVSTAHAEGGVREFAILTKNFEGDANGVKKLNAVKIEWTQDANGKTSFKEIPGSEFSLPADYVFLAMGFVGPDKKNLLTDLKLEIDERGNVKADKNKMTSVKGVFTAGDMRRGQSLIVWAIAEGRQCAKAIDEHLMGYSELRG
ncbi:glutamate synthase subunit beta [bacterium]|nr:glutamate synthase subunit beta [bacterium]